METVVTAPGSAGDCPEHAKKGPLRGLWLVGRRDNVDVVGRRDSVDVVERRDSVDVVGRSDSVDVIGGGERTVYPCYTGLQESREFGHPVGGIRNTEDYISSGSTNVQVVEWGGWGGW